MQKTLEPTKAYHSFSYLVWKETIYKPLKVAAAKSLFSSVYVIGTTCFDECFYSLWYLEDIIFRESLSFFSYFWSAMLLLSLKLVFWKKSVFYVLSLQ